MPSLPDGSERAATARKAIDSLPVTKILSDCRRRLLKLGSIDGIVDPLDYSNFGHFEALIQLLQSPWVGGVCDVNKSFGSRSPRAHVDLVGFYAGKPAWMIVSDRNPRHVSWPELRSKAAVLIETAVENPVTRPDFLIFYFARGLETSVAASFEEEYTNYQVEKDDLIEVETEDWFLVEKDNMEEPVNSGWIDLAATVYRLNVSPDSVFEVVDLEEWKESTVGIVEDCLQEEFCNILKMLNQRDDGVVNLVNLDTTALIGLVSGISNGMASSLAWCPLQRLELKFADFAEFFKTQALLELDRPFLGEVAEIFRTRKPIVSEFAWKEFETIVSVTGGPKEKKRAAALKNCLEPFIVLDNPSQRVTALPVTRKIQSKHVLVFGTGDSYQAPTLTSNMSFIRAAMAQHMAIGFIEHRPLALTRD